MRPVAVLLGTVLAFACSLPPRQPPTPRRPSDTYPEARLVQDRLGHTYLAAIERAPEGERVAFVASHDFGASWSPARALAGGARAERRQLSVAVGAPGEVYLVWVERRQGPDGIYFDRSLDAGASWLPEPVRLVEGGASGAHPDAPRLLADDRGDVYLVWWDDREGFDAIYATRARDRGATWLLQPQRLTSLSFGAKALLRAACDRDGTVYATWSEWSNGTWRLRGNVSTDYGETWGLREVDISSGRDVLASDLAVLDGGLALAAWVEGGPGTRRLYTATSRDRGRSWDAPQRRGAAIPGNSSPPRIVALEPSEFDVAWRMRDTAGHDRLVLARSRDAGLRFTEQTFDRVTPVGPGVLPLQPPPHQVPFAFTADTAGNAYFAWVEPSIGALDVHFERLNETTPDWTPPRSDLDLQVRTETLLDSPHWIVQVPQVVADDYGRVCLLWNVGYAIQVGTSSFYGESAWQLREF